MHVNKKNFFLTENDEVLKWLIPVAMVNVAKHRQIKYLCFYSKRYPLALMSAFC